MGKTVIDEGRLKDVMKAALVEVLEERKDLFYDLISEVLEDIALIHAIRDGEKSEPVSKAEVLHLLEGEV